MGKVVGGALKVVGVVAGIAAAAVTGGASLGISAALLSGVSLVATTASSLLAGTPSIPQSATQLGRLQASLDTQAPRKMVLGTTAMPADIRYYEGSGEDEKTIEYIIAVAAHKVREITELWIEDELAWSATGGIAAQFVDYLGVEGYTEGSASNTRAINGGARWGSDDRLTGCAYLYVRVERLGVSEDEQSPFANGLPGRVTIIGEGMPMYDPRLDSTVGGSGSMRVDNQLTWGPSSENPIIQSLNVLLGWRINGKLSVGGGLPAKYIDLDSAITAANICDEDIALSGGGTQARYRGAGAFSTDDAPMAIVSALLAGCAGDLLDSDGRLSFLIKTNTLAAPVVTFDDHDILSAASWDPMGGQTNLPNIISGTFTDPSSNSLYQPVPYPSVSLPSEDGIERTAPLDLGVVENAPQAERLAKQTLQRMQYPGLFSAEYNMKAMAAKVGTIVWQTLSPRGWVNKPFRVVSQKPSRSGRIALVLREEHEDIYAWAAEDSASVQPAEPVRFDRRNTGPILLARKAAEKANWTKVKDDDPVAHPKPEDGATVGAPPGTPVGDRPAEDVVSAIDLHTTHLADLDTSVGAAQGDIADLFATYGDTASAAQSAADAAASLTTVQGIEDHIDAQKLLVDQARIAAQAAEDGATDQAGFASADRQLAQTARGGAESARDTAIIARDTAQGHAATATTQAGLAAGSATEAGNEADAAAISSTTATTKANEATTQAGIATTQAGIATAKAGDATQQAGFAQQYKADAEAAADDSAGSSASASLAQALTAESKKKVEASLANEFPKVLDPALLNDSIAATGNAYEVQSIEVSDPNWIDAGRRSVTPSVGTPQIGHNGLLRYEIGRTYKLYADVEVISGGGQPSAFTCFYGRGLDGDFGFVTNISWVALGQDIPEGQRVLVTGTVGPIGSVPAGVVWARPGVLINRMPGIASGNPNAQSTIHAFWVEDVTESTEAAESATAAITNAAVASTKRDEASGFAATASTQAGLAVSAKNDAQTAAGVSTTQAAIATDKAAASQTIFENVASLRSNALNKNAGFDDYPSAAVGAVPTGWGTGAVNIGGGQRVPGPTGGYSWRLPAAAGVEVYGRLDSEVGAVSEGEYLVLRGELTLNSGSLISSGMFLVVRSAAGGDTQTFTIDFWSDMDSTGTSPSAGGSIAGKTYRFEKKIRVTLPSANRFSLHPMSHWSGYGRTLEFANDITWHECSVSPPTAADASVGIITGAIVGPDGPAAFLRQIVAASGGNPAMMQMLAGQNGSRIGQVADVIALGNEIDGIIETVLWVEGGVAKMTDALIRNLQVAPIPASQIYHDVMLKPRIYIGGDGDTIQYQGAASYGANPARIDPDLSGLPALAEGESYDVKAVSITPTQFTARAKKVSTPVDVTQQSNAGTNKGSGVDPRWQTNKPTTANAHDGYYEFTFFGTVPKTSQQGPDGGYYYRGSVTLKGRTSAGWQVLENVQITRYLAGGLGSYPPFTNFSQTETVQTSADLGSGADRFGVQPSTGTTITAFERVRYVTRTSASTTAITNDIRWTVYPPGNG